ncbi:MAG TPA: dihydroorotate dehydrogenase-like protein [Bacteroidetes bacterium]|nr:dihydroorotate dehydrogenase-like protein [Bacteroidota bacterium]
MDLSTRYLGLTLKNPIVPSAGPLSHSLDSMKRLEDAGAAAVVMYSLFEEQIEHEAAALEHYIERTSEVHAEAASYFPEPAEYNLGPDQYLELLGQARRSLEIPVIASLNGVSSGGWMSYARRMEEAGAHAIELNVYFIPTDPKLTSQEVEDHVVNLLHEVKNEVKVPVAMKLSPFFSSFAHVATRLDRAGANGLVLFNRFYQPDLDLDELEVKPGVVLSTSDAIRLPLRWIAILHGKVKASLAATSGIHTAEDVIKMIMAGADVTMMCSALLKHGPQRISEVLTDVERWMVEREYVSIEQMKGSMSQKSVADPSAFERANYMKALNRYR